MHVTTEDGGHTTVDVNVMHKHWPCAGTYGERCSCQDEPDDEQELPRVPTDRERVPTRRR